MKVNRILEYLDENAFLRARVAALEVAGRRLADAVDNVCGWIETVRPDDEARLEGLEHTAYALRAVLKTAE